MEKDQLLLRRWPNNRHVL